VVIITTTHLPASFAEDVGITLNNALTALSSNDLLVPALTVAGSNI
jgi:hypothetical protein